MPGKYSYSAVLADYSSRGIINLPDDQHLAYLKTSAYPSSPRSTQNSNSWTDRSPAAQPRSKSALAYTNRYTPDSGRLSSASRHVIVDNSDSDEKDPPASKRQPIQQRPATSHDSRSLPKRGRHLAAQHLKESAHSKPAATAAPGPRAALQTSRSKEILSDTSKGVRGDSNRAEIRGASRNKTLPPLPPLSSQQRILASYQPPIQPSVPRAAASTLQPAAGIKSKTDHAKSAVRETPAQSQSLRSPPVVQAPQRKISQETQMYRPTSSESQPDFDGFSDLQESSDSFFDQVYDLDVVLPEENVATTNQPSRRFETPSPRFVSTRTVDTAPKVQRPASTEPSDTDVRAGTGTSPHSHGRLSPLTSVSTISSKGTSSAARGATELGAQDWRLPEIDENNTFGPDFFTQGPEDHTLRSNSDDSIDSFLDRPLGTISAGRDIDLTRDYDEDSEVDAACPPDIGRFRAESPVKGPTFVQTTQPSSLINQVPSTPVQPPKSKGGFFARFRPRRLRD